MPDSELTAALSRPISEVKAELFKALAHPARIRILEVLTAGEHDTLRVTEGKELLEVRPAVDWHKGRAVEFLLDQIDPPQGSPVLYIGDDRTDEDAFRALRARSGIHGEGVAVGDPPPSDTAATAYVRTPGEVAKLLEALAEAAPR